MKSDVAMHLLADVLWNALLISAPLLAATLLVQLDGKKYVAVWPDKSAVHPPALPFKGWG